MATRWDELIEQSLVELGVLVNGESAEDKDIDQGLSYARGMLEDWELKGLMVPGRVRFSYEFADSVTSFTIGGTEPDIDRTPPIRIRAVRYCRAGSDSWYPLTQVSDETLTSSPRPGFHGPTRFVFDNSHPQATLFLNRATDPGDTIQIIAEGMLTDGTDLARSDELDLPSGYERAIRLNLAIEMAASYGVKDKKLPRTLIVLAANAINNIRKKNVRPVNSRVDPALVGTRKNFLRSFHRS